jgi:hypothetical protein
MTQRDASDGKKQHNEEADHRQIDVQPSGESGKIELHYLAFFL